ncbi:MAG: hypothetical protein V1735_06590 [Nanoarchaeota archaeon]
MLRKESRFIAAPSAPGRTGRAAQEPRPCGSSFMAIVIEQKELADTYRQFFNFMWEKAEP